jgi:DNA damage-inducible protein 1
LLKLIAHFLQCSIDLKKNVLRIGTTGTDTSFLSERELPECARLSSQTEEDAIGQSVREAEERDLARALQNSRELG